MSRALSLCRLLLCSSVSCVSELPAARPAPAPVVPLAAPRPATVPAPVTRTPPPEKPAEVRPGPVVPPEHLPAFDPVMLRSLGADGARKLELAASVCPSAVLHDKGKLRVGCRACPPFDASTGPDAQIVVDPDQFYELEAVYLGSFTRPGAREAAAVFRGCEAHVDNFGGTLLVRRTGEVWTIESYRSGFHPLECKPFARSDGRDILVCRWETDHQSYAHWLLDSYDFAPGSDADPEAGWTRLLAVDDNSVAACTDPPELRRPIESDDITGFRVEPKRPGAAARLLVDARFSHGPRTAAYEKKCAELARAEDGDQPINVRGALKLSSQRLVFAWEGDGFVANAGTRALLERLGLSAGTSSQH